MKDIFDKLKFEIEQLKHKIKNYVIGKSVLGEDIICFEVGSNEKKSILIHGGIHAREYITCFLVIELIKFISKQNIDGKIYFIPLLNPDGVRICCQGYSFIQQEKQRNIVKNILKNVDKSLYKANANGVDLNVNFDVDWGKGIQNSNAGPDYQNFIGYTPNSESEVVTIIDFTKKIKPLITLSYHSKGQVIYYGYKNQPKNNLLFQDKILSVLTNTTHYEPIFTVNSSGGYKDYCLMKLNILGFTIEVGNDKLNHPIGLEYLDSIFYENKNVINNILTIL